MCPQNLNNFHIDLCIDNKICLNYYYLVIHCVIHPPTIFHISYLYTNTNTLVNISTYMQTPGKRQRSIKSMMKAVTLEEVEPRILV